MECKLLKEEKNFKIKGLSYEQVKERIIKGEVNIVPKTPAKTVGQILKSNFFTTFNALNLVLAAAVFIAGSPKNAIFAVIIIVNSLIGVFQELSAKKTVEKLSVLSKAHAKVLRDGKIATIDIEEIVKNDVIYLSVGDQVLADGILVDADELEVDESMLTGEADPIHKKKGDKLYSGSFIVSGEGYGEVLKVGEETYTSKLADGARKFKITNSELQESMNTVLKYLIWIIIPVGFLLTFSQLMFTNVGWQESVIATVSGIIGMVPEGLVLLTSATFIVSIVKLGEYNTLVQELSATEILARVDVLCLDKTGTITEGSLNVVETINIGNRENEEIDHILSAIAYNLPSKNPTQKAILKKYCFESKFKVIDKKPFSSSRKWGGVILAGQGTWVLGAPEVILNDTYDEVRERVEAEAERGHRVLLLAKVDNDSLQEGIHGDIEKAALILIEDVIRKDAPDTLEFFKREGVDIKIISGDNPVTVSAVATRAGVKNSDKYIDARELPEDPEKLKDIVDNYTVFGRVTPTQKRSLVKALQINGHTVGMTGDGVNDVLALKEADCGIAMANGSDASKAVAQLVLLNSNFNALPKVVAEGRKQINNLERVAQLFLSKTVYSIMLGVIFSLLMLPYPILPIQMSLVGCCAIGVPAFFLALGPNNEVVKKGYLTRILSSSIPGGIVMGLFTISSYLTAYYAGASLDKCRTLTLFILAGVSLMVLLRVSLPLSKFKIGLFVIMMSAIVLMFITPIGRLIFSLTQLSTLEWGISGLAILLSWPILNIAVKVGRKQILKRLASN